MSAASEPFDDRTTLGLRRRALVCAVLRAKRIRRTYGIAQLEARISEVKAHETRKKTRAEFDRTAAPSVDRRREE